jgi:hypothetical protein
LNFNDEKYWQFDFEAKKIVIIFYVTQVRMHLDLAEAPVGIASAQNAQK